MTKLWIEWKTNGRFPTRSTVPWKSRKGGEIPTFPQLRRLLSHAQKTGEQKTEGCGRVEIQNQDSHFSTAPKACGARKVPGQHPFAPDATHTKQRGGKRKRWAEQARRKGNRPTRARPSWDVCSRKQLGIKMAMLSATSIRRPTLLPLNRRKSLASVSIWKSGNATGATRKRRLCWAMAPNGSGTLPTNISLVRFRSSISFTPANTCGIWHANCIPTKKPNRDAG